MQQPLTSSEIEKRFANQVKNLLAKNYPKLAHLSETEFLKLVEPLKETLKNQKVYEEDIDQGSIPFVIVITDQLVSVSNRMEAFDFHGKTGFEKLFPKTPADFSTIESVAIPSTTAYLITDIDRGKESLNIRPEDALKAIQQAKRSPLTIDEGIAILTQYPEFLQKNNCFSLLASRCGDQKVPALWISEKRPKLGWCWDRNPHTWLGSASCKERLS